MLPKTGLSLGVLAVSVLLIAGCEEKPPIAPTPPVVATPPPAPAPTPPPPEPAALDSLAINPPSVQSQGRPDGIVTLTTPAPTGGAVVVLSSGNPGIAKVPSGMTVQAGATTGTFSVDTSTVSVPSPVTIIATYLGVTKMAVLTVQPPPLVARFTVTSPSRGADSCSIINGAGAVDCQIDASGSEGFAARFIWALRVGSNDFTQTTSDPVFLPGTSCGFLGGATLNSDGSLSMTVSLQVEDRSGNRISAVLKGVAIAPNSRCGY